MRNLAAIQIGAQQDFGSTWSGIDDLTMPAAMATGNTAIAQMLIRRYTTTRGRLLSDPNFGLNLGEMISAQVTSAQLTSYAKQANAEATKDERILSATISLSFTLGVVSVSGTILTANGPFQFVISISSLTVALLQVSPQ